eukprot:CAMPEP_0194679476 /NCGR_PEP_ID=MMETSP0295-20121207/10806_1 /TAXON_ID=39354 /ORGANISM="Heterosigma akashiwo, Strain CCMP2393" /LENGTH=108 /DNA_ID=CAMNT_0039564869 /DNA_START=124 /DNA_END=447 /DNA_ORIENTATION=+
MIGGAQKKALHGAHHISTLLLIPAWWLLVVPQESKFGALSPPTPWSPATPPLPPHDHRPSSTAASSQLRATAPGRRGPNRCSLEEEEDDAPRWPTAATSARAARRRAR